MAGKCKRPESMAAFRYALKFADAYKWSIEIVDKNTRGRCRDILLTATKDGIVYVRRQLSSLLPEHAEQIEKIMN